MSSIRFPSIAIKSDLLIIEIPYELSSFKKIVKIAGKLLLPVIMLIISMVMFISGVEWYYRIVFDIFGVIAFLAVLNKVVWIWKGKEIIEIDRKKGTFLIFHKGIMEQRMVWEHISNLQALLLFDNNLLVYKNLTNNKALQQRGKNGEIKVKFENEEFPIGLTLEPQEALNLATQIQQFITVI